MWNPIAAIGNFFHSLFDKAGAFIKKMWNLAEPFLSQMLSQTAANALDSLQALAIAAVSQIATQGLPNDDAKRKAFADYMKAKLQEQSIVLKDSELNLLRETAVAIWKKANE
jgi:hypothetical protein